jgi:hypothetical protein
MVPFSQPLLRLPIKFDAEVLAEEVRALSASAWHGHPMKFQGNDAVRLITAGGEPTDIIEGAMAPTPELLACPYVMQIMAAIGAVWGRSRFMGLEPGSEVPLHVDSHYYWRTHVRIHIPVITNPDVHFTCGGQTVHMAAGECWVFDSFQRHEVHNRGSEKRVHLVLDTVGGGRLTELIEAAERGGSGEPKIVAAVETQGTQLAFERVNVPEIMSPWEIQCHVTFLDGHVVPHPSLSAVARRTGHFIQDWTALWAQFGDDASAGAQYAAVLAEARRDLLALGAGMIPLTNGTSYQHVFDRLIAEPAIKSSRQPAPRPIPAPAVRNVS